MSEAVRRFLTEDGWSEWMDLDKVLNHPAAPGSINLYDGLPILKQETKPSRSSSVSYPMTTTSTSLEPLESQLKGMGAAMARVNEAIEEQMKEAMLGALGIGLNNEEPDVLTAEILKEKTKEISRMMTEAAEERRRTAERLASEKAYEDNDDYGQF